MYYLRLALLGFRRNALLTALIVTAIGIGIGVCMTAYTMFHATSGDPIPGKSSTLYVPLVDSWGPDFRQGTEEPGDLLSYRDALALLQAKLVPRQVAMYSFAANVVPRQTQEAAFRIRGRATQADFFAMFEAPYQFGSAWLANDDLERSNIVVLSDALNKRLFGGGDSTGQTMNLGGREYRVVGVLKPWSPQPRVYDVVNAAFGSTEDVFMPFSTAVDAEFSQRGYNLCTGAPPATWQEQLSSECLWIHMWIEAPTPEQARGFSDFLEHYAQEQRAQGRFNWAPNIRLRNGKEWLAYKQVVSAETRISLIVAFGFLLVCLVNGVALILAKFAERTREVGIRRALGASRRAIFTQYLVEAGVIGIAAGLSGLIFTIVGLAGQRAVLSTELKDLASPDLHVVLVVIALAVVSTLIAGAYPAWRVSAAQPGLSARGS
jgi:putative ABC transport system permease protein